MAKGPTRPTDTVIDEVPEIDLKRCPARRVRIVSDHSPAALRRMKRGTVRLSGESVVIMSGGRRVAAIVSATDEIRACLKQEVSYEAELDTVTDEYSVQIRPIS